MTRLEIVPWSSGPQANSLTLIQIKKIRWENFVEKIARCCYCSGGIKPINNIIMNTWISILYAQSSGGKYIHVSIKKNKVG